MEKKIVESELPDNYPMYELYLYVIDGKVVRATRQMTVGECKLLKKCKSIKNCDIAARGLWHEMV